MKATVVGLGTMGPGIAATMARGGWTVACFDVSAEQTKKAAADLPQAHRILEQINGATAGSIGAVSFGTDLTHAIDGADLIVEAVPERIDLKQTLFAQFDQLTAPTVILASNTSGIPITKLQEVCRHRERVIGMHWSNPPHVIPVVEVIAGAATSPEVVAKMQSIVTALGLKPVLVKKDVPGFVHNRLLYALLRESVALVEAGVVDPEELDTCFKWALGLKLSVIGPMELLDVAGLDIYQAVAGYLNADLDNGKAVPRYITERTQSGRLGLKSGSGVYEYVPEGIPKLRAGRAGRMVAVRKALEEH